MSEETATAEAVETTPVVEETPVAAEAVEVIAEEISYHAVEKDGNISAIWEMQGRKHLRTIDPRSHEGKQILQLEEEHE